MFPKGFIFGAATAAYQIEGAWNVDGKGPSIWDNITHTRPDFSKGNANGDVAADSYHKYKEDVSLMKYMGLKMYRFSISWSRILPNGRTNDINQAGLDYYTNLIDELLANDIEPMVTIYHWDLPQALQDIGGWLNPDIADIFADYADLVFRTYGSKVKWWVTLNEAYMAATGYGSDGFAPALTNLHGVGEYLAGHNMLRAHGKAYRLYKAKYSHFGGKVSMAFAGWFCVPWSDSLADREASERCHEFTYGWFSHPIYIGDYPPSMRVAINKNSQLEGRNTSRLPYFTAEEIREIKGSSDFYGLNHYTISLAKDGPSSNALTPSLEYDMRTTMGADPSWTPSAASWLKVVPQSLRLHVQTVKTKYNNPEIVITENGYADDGSRPTDDPERIKYLESYMAELRRGIYEDGCNVTAHLTWSLLDNFEWRDGYTVKFGLVSVDFASPNRTRSLKRSGYWLKDYVNMHKILY
ncbi:glycoside hydrolases [Nesidiocoris tenuis]|uniref:Glycoside hydrolases n=1 Tax=Nesidiocoris tenuis TaxID=355587 RepID=A0ABN7AAA8_9HEMI|nr:glycoside hydrolases [Nesidiocoris tenuis]